jgi:hypothetical protein
MNPAHLRLSKILDRYACLRRAQPVLKAFELQRLRIATGDHDDPPQFCIDKSLILVEAAQRLIADMSGRGSRERQVEGRFSPPRYSADKIKRVAGQTRQRPIKFMSVIEGWLETEK